MTSLSFTYSLTDTIQNGIDITQIERRKYLPNHHILNLSQKLPRLDNDYSQNLSSYSQNLFTYLANITTPYVSKAHAKQLANILDIDFYVTENTATGDVCTLSSTDTTYYLSSNGIWATHSYGIWHIYRDEEPILAIFNNYYLYKNTLCNTFEDLLTLVLADTLTPNDTVFFDWFYKPNQKLSQACQSAKTIAVLHSNYHAQTNSLLANDTDHLTNHQLFHLPFDTIAVANIPEKNTLKKYFPDKSFIVIPPKTNFSDRFTDDPKPFAPRHFVTISSLTKGKNLEELIYAIGYYNSAYREIYNLDPIYLDIYGQGPEEYALQEAISKTKMKDYVTLKGQLNAFNTIAHYNGYLSTSHSESYGISLLEALSQGLPLIGLDVPIANQNYIPHTGYLISVDSDYNFSYLDYAKAIDDLMTNHETLQKQIKNFLNQPLYHPNATKNAYERLNHE